MLEKKSEQQTDVEIFTVVRHNDKTYCVGCFLDSGGKLEDAQPLDMESWDSESPPKCSLCFKEHSKYTKRVSK